MGKRGFKEGREEGGMGLEEQICVTSLVKHFNRPPKVSQGQHHFKSSVLHACMHACVHVHTYIDTCMCVWCTCLRSQRDACPK